MAVDKIDIVEDPRVSKLSAHLNGRTYGYLLADPKGEPRGTIFLVHGFPDLSAAWRYQIPMLLELGLRVVAPDCMGYGRTDAPSYLIADYGFKRASEDFKELARQLGCSKIILGGHDWGGAVVYRFAQYFPFLVSHVFSICTPYFVPQPRFMDLHTLVSTHLPNFRYQIDFASGRLEEAIQSPNDLRGFFNGAFGGKTPDGKRFLDNEGFHVDRVPHMSPQPLLTERELEFYVSEYARHGLHGPLNWYRTREVNFVDDKELIGEDGKEKSPIRQPVLFVQAKRDAALPPFMSEKMGESISLLTKREVDTNHWALWEKPEEINDIIREWLVGVALGGKSKL